MSPLSRRSLIRGGAASAAAVLASVGFTDTAAARDIGGSTDPYRLTVLGTTDLHGNIFNWDYFKDAEYDDTPHNDVGLAKVSTLVEAVRTERGAASTLLIDAGDTIQGTPLAYYYAKVTPIGPGVIHPMAAAMNAMRYDAAALGNHEFNYGIPLLRTFEQQLNFPLLGANAVDVATGRPAFRPFVIKPVWVPGRWLPLWVGVLGLTNPGIAIWDRANVEGRMEFPGLVEQAAYWVPIMKQLGADVVVVSAHSGADTSSSYGDALPWPENAATLVAEQVPDIDAILVGHAHQEIAERRVVNTVTGREVVLTEPLRWGMRLSVLTIDVRPAARGFEVTSVTAQVLNSNTVAEDPAVVELLQADHQVVLDYVNSVVGTSAVAMSAATARYEDTAAIDFVNYVQADAVRTVLTGTEYAALPVLSIAAPFNREAAIPQGDVSVRDVAGLYIFDNTLQAVLMSGSDVREYLEFSARYFRAVTSAGPFTPDEVTNAVTATAPGGTPDYNYDVMGGLTAPLAYRIDLGQPVGSRIVDLTYAGAPLDPAGRFVIAINNYRASGGGSFPHTADATVVYNAQVEIRQLIIDWVTANGTIDPAVFASTDWSLTYQGAPLQISG
ncbi:5'-nucleotidase C-terminal domain-containing protein [Nakamurella flavida]|uniref:5'-nucleotidase C-terminal domain-containing protein n=1 Tax=Nakamurella flavida TaxID=363630 RepID=A0A938YQB3_9ACTN|nr:5'-nucleotidase C-terminal domain-containing protein [Nakamurella flavida]MBM9477439.1 5'-nucleotidase C-terminal domain-containing protein [Nakamurella flavida]MDP9777372.1 2',3'-cyclic-nucleotide 2'-phosphodiesterase/3'-nucleotidase [Nakamurella flavida]